MTTPFPDVIPNVIAGKERSAVSGRQIVKVSPATGAHLSSFARSDSTDVAEAVAAARTAQEAWAELTPVRRGDILHDVAVALGRNQDAMAQTVHLETGKSLKDAAGETSGAVRQGLFMAGEGMRLYGRTTTSAVPGKEAMTIRCPIGVAGLIIAANTPIANVAWKVFPALVCGNTAVLKAPEDTPATAWLFARIAREAGLPDGVLNVVQGLGAEAGQPIAEHHAVDVVSFTGSTTVGRQIAEIVARRVGRVSLELGGKNALVVCDDADIEKAVHWTILSVYSNAGQRCASAGRVIVLDAVYDAFRERLLERVASLRLGTADEDDFGPVINVRQLERMVQAIKEARAAGARILAGGERATTPALANGCYLAPTVIEGASPGMTVWDDELFGPIAVLARARDFDEAVAWTNASRYGLTAAIHTRDFDRAMSFVRRADVGVVSVNGGTYGSEPHMPFGGTRQSGNGTREPGTEALDVYSTLKDVYLLVERV